MSEVMLSRMYLEQIVGTCKLACWCVTLREKRALTRSVCLQQAEYSELVETLLSSQQDPVIYQRLADAFNKLTASSTPPTLDRKQKMAFLKSLEEFMANVGGLLCVK